MPNPVPDTEDSIKICRLYCGTCPTFKPNKLNEIEPHALFCSRGKSSQHLSEIKNNGCFCFGCDNFKKYELEGGWFCIYGKDGKK